MATEMALASSIHVEIESMYEKIYNGSLGDIEIHVADKIWYGVKRLMIAKCPKLEKDIRNFYGQVTPSIYLKEYSLDAVGYFLKYLYTGAYYPDLLTPKSSIEIQQLFKRYELPIDPKFNELALQFIKEDPYTAITISKNLKMDDYFELALKKIREIICKCYGPFHLFHDCGAECGIVLSAKEREELNKIESEKLNKLPSELRTIIFSKMYTVDERKTKELERKKEIAPPKLKTDEDPKGSEQGGLSEDIVIVDKSSPESASKISTEKIIRLA